MEMENESSNYNLSVPNRNWRTRNIPEIRLNTSIDEMMEAFELTNAEGSILEHFCLFSEPKECKISPRKLTENDFEEENTLFAQNAPECFQDSDTISTNDFIRQLENEESIQLQRKFQCPISPFAQSASFKKEENIFLSKERQSSGLLKTSDASLTGLAYNVDKNVTGNKITFKIGIHNMGRQTIYAEAQLCLYSTVRKIVKDLRFNPSQLVLEDNVLQKIHISFTCETESFDKLNLPYYGFVILKYINESGKDQSCQERPSFMLEPSARGRHEMVQETGSKSLTAVEEGWWNIEPSEILLGHLNQKARVALINYSGRNIRFKLQWDCCFICVSPIHGIISANGALGLRLNLPKIIKYGETLIRVICNNSTKTLRIIVKK